MRQYIDRGDPLSGIQTAVRDSRVPYNMPRALQNVTLRDRRIRRRSGCVPFSQKRINGVQLCKATKSTLENIYDDDTAGAYNSNIFKTPLSYGLLQWGEYLQPRRDKDLCIEFVLTLGDKEELVQTPFTRVTNTTYGASVAEIRGSTGVFVYDQAVLANYVDVKIGANVYNVTPESGTSTHVDVFSLTTLSVSYNEHAIVVMFDLWDDGDSAYVRNNQLTFPLTSYTPGAAYHLSILFLDNTIYLYVNGSLADTFELPADHYFVGESDVVNAHAHNLELDVVLLNEFTARANYQSTCKPYNRTGTSEVSDGHNVFRSSTSTDARPEPWCASPPVGTGLHELRFWSPTGTLADIEGVIVDNLFSRITVDSALDLLAYYPVAGTTPFVKDEVNPYRGITLHHTDPTYVADAGLLYGRGVVLADGQHVIRSFGRNDYFYVEPTLGPLAQIFRHVDQTLFVSRHDFTVEIQIRTPSVFNREINRRAASIALTGTKSDTRDGNEYAKNYGLVCAGSTPSFVEDENGTTVSTNQMRHHRAFDATLWSVEAAWWENSTDSTNFNTDGRTPLARGLLTPDGKVAFEFFGWDAAANTGRELRVVSSTVLDVSSVYSLVFRKRTLVAYDSGVSPARTRAYGFALEIFINDSTTPDAILTIGDGLDTTDITDANMCSSVMVHGGIRDVIIGASYVNDHHDGSIRVPNGDSTAIVRTYVTQRFMSPYQDQPGFFRLGYFRMWDRAIADSDVALFYNKKISSKDYASLIMELTVPSVASDKIVDTSKYAAEWQLGYKGWGFSVPRTDLVAANPNGVQVGYALQDCIGYASLGQPTIDIPEFRNTVDKFPCTGLGFYSPTLTKTFGVLASFGGLLRYSERAESWFQDLLLPGFGIMSNFYDRATWNCTNIADVAVLTSSGGRPKVFDGRTVSPLGYGRWSGGLPFVAGINGAGVLTGDKYYGVRIAYYSAITNTYDVSPQIVVKLVAASGHDTIRIWGIPPSSDPRVTNILVLVTTAQDSFDLAYNTAPHAVQSASAGGYLPNKQIETFYIYNDTVTFTLDLDFTEAPQGSTSASYNGKLYIAGDINIPDVIYYSANGNPHLWYNYQNRIVLEDSSGDRIVALRSLFGSLYAFKPNGIWKIDEVAVDVYNVQKIASIGPSTEASIETITIPDSGRIAVVFWSQFGPYLFDEVNLRYIGYPVEATQNPFGYLDHNSIFVVHDIVNRQLYFFYKTSSEDTATYANALVYNYRFDVWTGATGLPGSVGLSVDLTKNVATRDDNVFQYELSNLALLGDDNGKIYKLSPDVETDGHLLSEYIYDVASYSNSEVTLSVGDTSIADYSLSGLWVTLASKNTHLTAQVQIRYNLDGVLYLDVNNAINWFTPEADDVCYIGYAPLYVEFPWDLLDVAYYSKQIQRIVMWTSVGFSYRVHTRWTKTAKDWSDFILKPGDLRQLIDKPVPSSEAFKLEIQSLQSGFYLDAYGFLVEATKDATI